MAYTNHFWLLLLLKKKKKKKVKTSEITIKIISIWTGTFLRHDSRKSASLLRNTRTLKKNKKKTENDCCSK